MEFHVGLFLTLIVVIFAIGIASTIYITVSPESMQRVQTIAEIWNAVFMAVSLAVTVYFVYLVWQIGQTVQEATGVITSWPSVQELFPWLQAAQEVI